MNTGHRSPVLQRPESQKDAVFAHAEHLFAEAEVPMRPGRLLRLIGRALDRTGDVDNARIVVEEELSREWAKLHRPRLRNVLGIADPTGQTAAHNVDAARTSQKKIAPITVAAARGE